MLTLDALEDVTKDVIPLKKARAIFSGAQTVVRVVESGNLDGSIR